MFRIGLVDCPRMGPQKHGVVPDWTCGSSPRGALKTRRCYGLDSWMLPAWSLNLKNRKSFQIGPHCFFFVFFYIVLVSNNVERVSVSRIQNFSFLDLFSLNLTNATFKTSLPCQMNVLKRQKIKVIFGKFNVLDLH